MQQHAPAATASYPTVIPHPHRFCPGRGDLAATTMLLLHDAGASDTSLEPFGAALAPGACLLSPRGTFRDGRGGACFFRRDQQGAPHGKDLVRSTERVVSLLRVATPAYGLTPGRVIAVGLAHGATLGASLLLRSAYALAGAGPLRA